MQQSLQFSSQWSHCEASNLDWGSCHHSLMLLLHNYSDTRGVFSLARWSFTWNSSISIHFNLFKFCEMSLDRTAKRNCRLTTTINYCSSLIGTLKKLNLWRTWKSLPSIPKTLATKEIENKDAEKNINATCPLVIYQSNHKKGTMATQYSSNVQMQKGRITNNMGSS